MHDWLFGAIELALDGLAGLHEIQQEHAKNVLDDEEIDSCIADSRELENNPMPTDPENIEAMHDADDRWIFQAMIKPDNN